MPHIVKDEERVTRLLAYLETLVKESYSSARETQKTFHQTMTTVAAGAVALSITFVEKLAPAPRERVEILVAAWIAFAVSLLFVLAAAIAAQRERKLDRDGLHAWVYSLLFTEAGGNFEAWLDEPRYSSTPVGKKRYSFGLDIMSFLAFIAGLGLLLTFCVRTLD